MRYVETLSEKDKEDLGSLFKNHVSHNVRRRAHTVLLSAQKFRINEIARIYQIHRETIRDTLTRWEEKGIEGLYDLPKDGRPPSLSDEEEKKALEALEKDPRSTKKALALIQKETDKFLSEWTLKRIAKKHGLRWKRMRKTNKSKRNKAAFLQAKDEIDALHAQEARGELDVHYFDESGFNLIPEIPYAWQPTGETIAIPSGKSKRLNVLAFCSKKLDFYQRTVQGYVDSEIVIEFFDEFSLRIEKKTVVIIDNASVHTSHKFKSQLEKWKKKGLHIKYLPTYSPELNLIEILWRFIKYSWLPLSAYLSFKSLKSSLENVLDGIGTKYQITFA
ncbi:MAG: IS630 family transposase [Anaerolineae bacterium]|jgi:transposase|nr:IS630 family transposase [Anaerolineae bacterium]